MQSTDSKVIYIYSEWRGTLQSWSQQHNDMDSSPLLLLRWHRHYVGPIVIWSLNREWQWALQSWSQQHNDRDGSPLLSSDGADIMLDPLLYVGQLL